LILTSLSANSGGLCDFVFQWKVLLSLRRGAWLPTEPQLIPDFSLDYDASDSPALDGSTFTLAESSDTSNVQLTSWADQALKLIEEGLW
jgi:hypothetical protein